MAKTSNVKFMCKNMSLVPKASYVRNISEMLRHPAPQFRNIAVVNGQFKEISLAEYKGKYVVLLFYPLDFTFICPTEIIAFSDCMHTFKNINCEVLAISCDSQYSHLAWINTPRKEGGLEGVNIPLISDKSGRVARLYGIYCEESGISYRGLFIIDRNQNIRQITVNDFPVGRSVEEAFRLVKAFQFTDEHGEVCPVNWKPGGRTIKPDPNNSLEYFKDLQ